MATRSRIGILNEDGTITSVYCHWDGYLSYNGKILFESYNSEERVRELLSYGGISSLTPDIGVKHLFDCPYPYGSPEYDEYKKMTTFYGRDRGEEGMDAKVHPSVRDFKKYGEEYTYLFKDGAWTYLAGSRWVKLTEKNIKSN